jgi:hypothetical protein
MIVAICREPDGRSSPLTSNSTDINDGLLTAVRVVRRRNGG